MCSTLRTFCIKPDGYSCWLCVIEVHSVSLHSSEYQFLLNTFVDKLKLLREEYRAGNERTRSTKKKQESPPALFCI